MSAAPDFRDYDMPATACPSCGHTFDGAADTGGGRGPIPGDVTLCIECTDVLVFTDGLGVRWPTPDEWREFSLEFRARIRVLRSLIAGDTGTPAAMLFLWEE